MLYVELLSFLGPVDGKEGCAIMEVVIVAVYKVGRANETTESKHEEGRCKFSSGE
jgi:hypothetical protein